MTDILCKIMENADVLLGYFYSGNAVTISNQDIVLLISSTIILVCCCLVYSSAKAIIKYIKNLEGRIKEFAKYVEDMKICEELIKQVVRILIENEKRKNSKR